MGWKTQANTSSRVFPLQIPKSSVEAAFPTRLSYKEHLIVFQRTDETEIEFQDAGGKVVEMAIHSPDGIVKT